MFKTLAVTIPMGKQHWQKWRMFFLIGVSLIHASVIIRVNLKQRLFVWYRLKKVNLFTHNPNWQFSINKYLRLFYSDLNGHNEHLLPLSVTDLHISNHCLKISSKRWSRWRASISSHRHPWCNRSWQILPGQCLHRWRSHLWELHISGVLWSWLLHQGYNICC